MIEQCGGARGSQMAAFRFFPHPKNRVPQVSLLRYGIPSFVPFPARRQRTGIPKFQLFTTRQQRTRCPILATSFCRKGAMARIFSRAFVLAAFLAVVPSAPSQTADQAWLR